MKTMPATVTDIAWLQTSFIGDVILSTGAFALAGKVFPGVRQHLITTAVAAKALAGSPELASLIVFNKKGGVRRSFQAVKAQLHAALASASGAVLLQPHRSYRSGFLARYIGLPTVNYAESAWGGYAVARVPRVAVLNEAARVALLLEPIGVDRDEIVAAVPQLSALPMTGNPALAQALTGDGRLVGLAPGSVWGTKRWLPSGFRAVAQQLLAERPDLRLVMIGSAAEAPLVQEIVSAMTPPERARVIDLAGRTSLLDLRRLFPALSLVISNDSSPLHYAAAFDVPTVAIFGATIPQMGFGPLASRRISVGVTLACRPCSDHGPQVCPLGHFRCMRDLSAEAVMRACRELLAG